jgi:hypothetical protein
MLEHCWVATPEKALFDTLYLAARKGDSASPTFL